MALADIVRRIEEDADTEAEALVGEAEQEAAAILAGAQREAEHANERILADARAHADLQRGTRLANARLAARDRIVKAKLELAGRVLRESEAAILGLPDAEYAAFIARDLLASARGGETVRVSEADRERLNGTLQSALQSASGAAGEAIELDLSDESADRAHGVVLVGERMSVEVSPAAFVAGQREELMALVSQVLFGEDARPEDEE